METITSDELKAKIDGGDDFVLVETLPKEMFAHAHLPGAINVPPESLRQLAPRLLPSKETEIVVYCAGHG
jgi:rhodanese-related sulfurtransferase